MDFVPLPRNQVITDSVRAGESISVVAKRFGISRQRVSQIMHKEGFRLDRPRPELMAVARREEGDVRREAIAEVLKINRIRARRGDRPLSRRTMARWLGISGTTLTRDLHIMGVPNIQQPAQHGTKYMYSGKGCRCTPCRAANAAAMRAYTARKRREARA